MNRIRSAFATAVVLATAAGLAGCGAITGSSALPPTVPVKGKVTFRGKPLTSGSVEFEPIDAGMLASGAVQPDGTFTLRSTNGAEGVVAGKHRVSVSETKEPIPRKYTNAGTSQLVAEVSAEKPEVTLELK